jgi:hypothetical protein
MFRAPHLRRSPSLTSHRGNLPIIILFRSFIFRFTSIHS